MTLFFQWNRTGSDSRREVLPMTSDHSGSQPITADDAPITSDCSRSHSIAADHSALHLECDPL